MNRLGKLECMNEIMRMCGGRERLGSWCVIIAIGVVT